MNFDKFPEFYFQYMQDNSEKQFGPDFILENLF